MRSLMITAAILCAGLTMAGGSSNPSPRPHPAPHFALRFDGRDDVVEVRPSASLRMDEAVTMEGWVCWEGPGSSQHYNIILSRGGEYQVAVYRTGAISFAIHTASPGWHWVVSDRILERSVWTHVAVTYSAEADEVTVYVNGESAFAAPARGGIIAAPGAVPLTIGNWSDVTISPSPFLGKLA